MTDEFRTPLEDLGLPDPLGRLLLRGPRIILPGRLPVDLPLEVSPVRTVDLPLGEGDAVPVTRPRRPRARIM